jgi:hypothetical protein
LLTRRLLPILERGGKKANGELSEVEAMQVFNHGKYLVAITIVLAALGLGPGVDAATVVASTCSVEAVGTAVGLAADGDTVRIPACSPTTWASGLAVANKAVRIEGAGIDATTINLSGGVPMLSMTGTSAGNFVGGLGGLTITGFGQGSGGFIQISASYRFRLHHLKIGDVANRAILIIGSSGVIDHCTFTTTNGYNAIQVLGSRNAPSGRWSEPMTFGSVDQVYIEDNTFTAANCVNSLGTFDGYNGSRLVFRHNIVTNWSGYVHGYDSAGESALQTEIYDNAFDMANAQCSISQMLFIRGGSGYVFNNSMHLTDPYNEFAPALLSLYYYRSTTAQQGSICDGTAAVDENQPGMNGYHCFQQPGTGGPGPHQAVPWYEYNNVGTGNMPANLNIKSDSSHVIAGRDFINDTPKPGYSPGPYPHPCAVNTLAPPTGVRVIR